MSHPGPFLSTTALAKALHKEPKEVFALLARAHWMVKVDDRWHLTEKGRFEGGIYQQHPKFGDYVAWPESIVTHPIWAGLPEAPLSATQLGRHFDLPARLINLLLADLGWQSRGLKGWLLTDFGRLQGGEQKRTEGSNVPYVTWPERLKDGDGDLAGLVQALQTGPALDGRRYPDRRHTDVANWLYLHGFVVAPERQLAGAPGAVSFWLPSATLMVQIWHPARGPDDIQRRLDMDAWLKRQRAIVLPDDFQSGLSALDEWLPGQLLLQGVDSHT